MLNPRTLLMATCWIGVLAVSLKSTDALIDQNLASLFAEEQEEVLADDQITATTTPSRGLSLATFWLSASLVSVGNIAAWIKRSNNPTAVGELCVTLSWLVGSGSLFFLLHKNSQAAQKATQLFERLIEISKQMPLDRVIHSYNTLALQDEPTEKAFADFKAEKHTLVSPQQLIHRANAFMSKQVHVVARRLYLRRLAACCLAGLATAQIITGSFPCSWIGPKG